MSEGGDVWRYILSVDGRDIELSDGEVTLGRSRTSTVRVDHESVSRSHALLTFERGQAVVKDLNSSNGTYVGGRRVLNETRLSDGDRIQLGAAVIAFRLVAPTGPSDRTALMDSEVKAAALQKQPPSPAPAMDAPTPRPSDDEPSVPLEGARPPALPPIHGPEPIIPPSEPPRLPVEELSAAELLTGVPDDITDRSPKMGAAALALEAVRSTSSPGGPPPPPPPPPPLPPPVPAVAEPPARSEPPRRVEKSVAPEPPRRSTNARGVPDSTLAQVPIGPGNAVSSSPAAARSAMPEPRNLADFVPRLLAALVDTVILLALDIVLCSPVYVLLIFGFGDSLKAGGAAGSGPSMGIGFMVVMGLCTVLVFAANLGYVVGGWAKSGRTPGKSLLGLSVVTADRGPGAGLGWSVAFLRVVGMIVSGMPCLLGYLAILFRKDRRGFHDLIAGTWVVKVR